MSVYKNYENATKESELGPLVVHIYDIRNSGTSRIDEVDISFVWPSETLSGEPLMILLDQPETNGNMKCEQYYMGETNFNVEDAFRRKSYLNPGKVPFRNIHGASSSHHSKWTGSSSGRGGSGTRVYHSSNSSWSSSGSAGGMGGGRRVSTQDERNKLDFEENMESTGDASFVHRERAGQAAMAGLGSGGSTYYEKHHSSSSSGSGQRQGQSSHVAGGSSGGSQTSGSQTVISSSSNQGSGGYVAGRNQNQDRVYQSGSKVSYQGAGISGQDLGISRDVNINVDDSDRGSDRIDRIGSRRGESSGSRVQYETSQSSNRDSHSSRNSGFEGQAGSMSPGGVVKEYTYTKTWNSSAVNGGPAVTFESSSNRTRVTDEEGKVHKFETSTVIVFPEDFGGARWEASRQEGKNSGGSGYAYNSEGARVHSESGRRVSGSSSVHREESSSSSYHREASTERSAYESGGRQGGVGSKYHYSQESRQSSSRGNVGGGSYSEGGRG